ncbi:MAG: helix-turn-helix domain-containing protein [Clostridia bacterium]|nr:helix-turn-helix domain-containing protein [Clostridia bacterium]
MVNLSKFAERLDELIFEQSLQQKTDAKTLAGRLGLQGSTITRYLRAEREPTVKNLVLLADYFQCSTDFLLGRESNNSVRTFTPSPPFSEQLCKVLNRFGYSSYRFSLEANVHQSIVYAWKSGKRLPSLDNVVKMAEFFDCSVDLILGREK